MYKGFDVSLNTLNEEFYHSGKRLFDKIQKSTIQQLDKYIGIDGVINGSDLEVDWFSEIDSHIFISHSHKDEKLAISLAGYLYEKHGIKCFVDSCIWGYSNDLLKQIDDKYCRNIHGNTYSYEKRNFSTSHVYMMLSIALNKMIGKCEGFFLLNSPNSIQTSGIFNETYSPWLYSEIITSKLIEKKTPDRLLNRRTESFSKGSKEDWINEDLKVKYKVTLNHLDKLSQQDISNWGGMNSDSPENALDILYHLKKTVHLKLLKI